MFDSGFGWRRELFSWTTDEQALALRADRVLFSKSESAELGPGYAFVYLAQLAGTSLDPDQAALARALSGTLFEKKRYAWPEPWATRMGWPGEDYGSNLLRIVLKPEAWLVVVKQGYLSVWDMNQAAVPVADALKNPTRLGAILYVKDAVLGGPSCDGSFTGGGNGYREFILGNLAMVEEWSIGTPEIRARLSTSIADLNRLFERIRSCSKAPSLSGWNASVVCDWDAASMVTDEIGAYEQSLAIPSSNYFPTSERIATLIDTLEGDLVDPDPLIVTPGSP